MLRSQKTTGDTGSFHPNPCARSLHHEMLGVGVEAALRVVVRQTPKQVPRRRSGFRPSNGAVCPPDQNPLEVLLRRHDYEFQALKQQYLRGVQQGPERETDEETGHASTHPMRLGRFLLVHRAFGGRRAAKVFRAKLSDSRRHKGLSTAEPPRSKV